MLQPHEILDLNAQLRSLNLPAAALQVLPFQLPNFAEFDLKNPAHVCAASYFGFDFYPVDFLQLKRSAKKIKQQDQVDLVERLKKPTVASVMAMSGVKITESCSENSQFLANLLIGPRGSNSVLAAIATDFGFGSIRELELFYDELDRTASSLGFGCFRNLLQSGSYIDFLGPQKITFDSCLDPVLRIMAPCWVDTAQNVSENRVPGFYFGALGGRLLILEKRNDLIVVWPLISACFQRGLPDVKDRQVQINDLDVANILSLGRQAFGDLAVDFTPFYDGRL